MNWHSQQSPISERRRAPVGAGLGGDNLAARSIEWAHSSFGLTRFGYRHNDSHPARMASDSSLGASRPQGQQAALGRENVFQANRGPYCQMPAINNGIYRIKLTPVVGPPRRRLEAQRLQPPTTVCQALNGAPVASPQSRILHQRANPICSSTSCIATTQ